MKHVELQKPTDLPSDLDQLYFDLVRISLPGGSPRCPVGHVIHGCRSTFLGTSPPQAIEAVCSPVIRTFPSHFIVAAY